MTDKEFDRFLEDTIDAPPPVDLADEFTPWRSSMNRILWGTVWTTITLNFWYLDVILTATGHIMQLLGFRAMRRENRWFRFGYGLCWLRCIWWILNFGINCTIYSGEPEIERILSAAAYGMLVPCFLLLLALRNGVRTVQQKAGLPTHGGNGILVCFCLMVFFATAKLGGIAAIRQELLALGFPAHILDDLTQEDILSCKGAGSIMTEVNDHPVNNGREVGEQTSMGLHLYTVYEQKELWITGIAVELPCEKESWKIIHHFQFLCSPVFYIC